MASKQLIPEQSTWEEISKHLGGEAAILIGNGFSIACDQSFGYTGLLEVASQKGLPNNVLSLFDSLETANFEEIMFALDQAIEISQLYGCKSPCKASGRISKDVDLTKNSLVEAIAQVHGKFSDQTKLKEDRKSACIEFLKRFRTIYTLNYDFLLYWVWVRGLDKGAWVTGDGFYGNNQKYVNLLNGGIRYLHGALHIYSYLGDTYKHVYEKKKPLLDKVNLGLSQKQYPLFIAEGDHRRKLSSIRRNPYLHDCFDEFCQIGPDLVVVGTSLGKSDTHLVDAIRKNKYLKNLYIGYFQQIPSGLQDSIKQISKSKNANKHPLEKVIYFDTSNLKFWG